MLVLFIWNFTYGYLYSLIFSFCSEAYSESIKEQSVGILNIFWPGGAVAFIFYAQVDANWVNHIVYFCGYPIFFLNIAFFLLKSQKPPQNDLQQPITDANLNIDCPYKEARENQRNFIQDLLEKFKLLKSDPAQLKNSIIFMTVFILAQLSYACPFIAFNSLGGNLQNNVMASILCDFAGSFVQSRLVLFLLVVKISIFSF
ncbi:hypothetical protein IMG5_059960 [Ichthyophthirius multifiliis]|uniref:Uncharacterized protein n=1 Tax=Ichthyophthirius multifiliis TaxID=5932 RepID=G0QNM1_ICHMU|nr:hypothetical protein IMG5_059960 [Ichthyophthirius multifiliis]EGR33182.1 hypothetical protein IMG5_059960 [Ichthyophthirius multifiliis]|eukprot:XP_004037168.1 hypothetical protein IMG5_059960 [Ichthyophthirius multifiliis]